MSARYEVNVATLLRDVERVRQARRMTWPQWEQETGLSRQVPVRLRAEGKPDADTLLTLLMWLNAGAHDYALDMNNAADVERSLGRG